MTPEEFVRVLPGAQAGADWAWSSIYGALSGPLLAYARARGAADPDDVVGEVFLEMARRIRDFEGTWDAFRGWTFLLANRRVIDQHRRNSRRPEDSTDQVPERAGADATAEGAERQLAAEEAARLLEGISSDQREVLLLRIYADLPIEEVARATGRSVTAVKALQRRALRALRKEISRNVVSPG